MECAAIGSFILSKAEDSMINDRQERFCREYIIDLNATQAAKRAGYSEKAAYSQGYRLLKNVDVRARIDELQEDVAAALGITAAGVLLDLQKVKNRAMQAEPVMEWDYEEKTFVETGEYRFDSNGANRALELIGKHLGMFKDKVEGKVDVDLNIVVDYGDDH